MSNDGPWRLPPTLLPDGERADWWIRDGKLTGSPADGAEQLPGRFALPGLVDAHAHTSMGPNGPDTLEGTVARIRGLAATGVLVVRDVGSPKSLTLQVRPDADFPEFLAAGRWHAPKDRFYEAFHDPVEPDQLVDAAMAEIAHGAKWIKVIADFTQPVLSYDAGLLGRLVTAAHAAGARVAAHTQWPVVRDVVAAGVDSIEHGSLLDRQTLEVMAERGVAWTPTINAFASALERDIPDDRRRRYQGYLDNYRAMVPIAQELNMTILAGTDMAGTIVDEISRLNAVGMSPTRALRAASTDARTFLGQPSFENDARADVVTYDADPREDPAILAKPMAIVLRGRRIR